MDKAKVFELLMYAAMALSDGKIDSNEAVKFLEMVLKFAGIPLEQVGRYKLFIEQDGDVHIILNAELLKRLKFEL